MASATENRSVTVFLNTKSDPKSIAEVKKQYRDLSNIVNRTNKNTAEYRMGVKRLRELKSEIADHNQSIIGVSSVWNNVKTTALGVLGAGGILGAVSAVSRGIEQLNKRTKQTNQVAQYFSDSSENVDKLAMRIRSAAKVWDKDFNEVLQATNTVSKEFDISANKALALINEGFEKGADLNGEFLDILKEYPAQLDSVGVSADQAFALITQQVKEGIYSDKGIDAIKEAEIRIRELTPATKEAIDNIGLSSAQIQKDLESGAKTTFEVIQEVSRQIGKLPEQSSAVGTAIADIFGGPGEDAGLRYIKLLGNVNTNLSDVESSITGTAKAQLEWEKSLASFQERLLGTGFFDPILTSLFKVGSAMLDLTMSTQEQADATLDLRDSFSKQQEAINPLLSEYDELKSKGKLNQEEQGRLQTVINKIVEIVPTAATSFDVYGNALDINKDKVIANTEAQRELVRQLSGESISDLGEGLIEASRQANKLNNELSIGKLVTEGFGDNIQTFRRGLELEEAAEARIKIQDFNNEIQSSIETLLQFGLTQNQIIDLYNKSGDASEKQKQLFLDNLNVVLENKDANDDLNESVETVTNSTKDLSKEQEDFVLKTIESKDALKDLKMAMDGLISDDFKVDIEFDEEEFEEFTDNIKTASETLEEELNRIELEGLESGKRRVKIDEEQFNLRVKFLQDEIAARKEAGLESVEQEIELQNLLNEEAQKGADKRKAIAREVLNGVVEGLEIASEVLSRKNDRDIRELEAKHQKEMQLLEMRRNNEEISEREFNNTKQALQIQQEKAERKLKRKAFRDNQKLAIAQSLVQGYLATVTALATPPAPNIVAAGIAGALAAATTALIATQQPPAFKSGGVLPGPGTGEDDLNVVNDKGQVVAKVGSGEAVIPVDTVKENKDIIAKLLANKGKSISEVVSKVVMPEFNFEQNAKNVRLQNGGILDAIEADKVVVEANPSVNQINDNSDVVTAIMDLKKEINAQNAAIQNWQRKLQVEFVQEKHDEFLDDVNTVKQINTIQTDNS